MTANLTSRALLTFLMISAAGAVAQNTPPPAPANAPCPAPSQTQNQQGSQTTQNQSQSNNQSPNQSKPCTPPSAAEQFPFPGEPEKPANQPNAPGTTSPSDAAAEHPFPTTPPPKLPGSDNDSGSSSSSGGSSSSSSSSSSGDNDGTPDLPPGSEGTSVHRKPLPKITHVQTDDERVDEDINVAKFYLNDENYQGALLRAKDAVQTQPDYSLAHFTLAQILEKMKKKDEAIAEYQTYLKLDPEGEKKKDAKEALATLSRR